jgi:hypothetical protein
MWNQFARCLNCPVLSLLEQILFLRLARFLPPILPPGLSRFSGFPSLFRSKATRKAIPITSALRSFGYVINRTARGGCGRLGERRVTEVQKQKNYLSKAKEADEMAEKARDVLTREAWRKIAQNYRKLAGLEGGESKG